MAHLETMMAMAQKSLRKVKLSDIFKDDDIYPRQHVNQGRVAELSEIFENGVLDPISICELRGRSKYILLDGAHRMEVFKKHGVKEIVADDYKLLTKLEACKISGQLNSRGPLPLTRSDREVWARKLRVLGASDVEIRGITSLAMSTIKLLDSITYKFDGSIKRLPRALTIREPVVGGRMKETPIIDQSEISSHAEIIESLPRDFFPKAAMKHLNTLLEYDWFRVGDAETLRLAKKLYLRLKPLFEG